MHIFKEIAPLKACLKSMRSGLNSVGFVPTMGALHEGHLSLIRASRKAHPITVCSIFVNPTQFGNPEDLAKYPRTMESDLRLLEESACDVVFCPEAEVMYGSDEALRISFPGLDDVLEGTQRPGHFSGVAQVVAKLFHIVQPDEAYFGQKDYQQVMIVSRLIRALNFDLKITALPIVREPDGLAMSSRNQRLSADNRKQATVLYASLLEARRELLAGGSWQEIVENARTRCHGQKVNLEYLAMADRKDFTLLDHLKDPRQTVILIAAQVGPVRLIDNLFVHP